MFDDIQGFGSLQTKPHRTGGGVAVAWSRLNTMASLASGDPPGGPPGGPGGRYGGRSGGCGGQTPLNGADSDPDWQSDCEEDTDEDLEDKDEGDAGDVAAVPLGRRKRRFRQKWTDANGRRLRYKDLGLPPPPHMQGEGLKKTNEREAARKREVKKRDGITSGGGASGLRCRHKKLLYLCVQCWDCKPTREDVQRKHYFDYFAFCGCNRTPRGTPQRMSRCKKSDCPYKAARAQRTAHHAVRGTSKKKKKKDKE